MRNSLADLEPARLWKHFLALAKIPRGSGNEAAAAQYCADAARAMGHEVSRDPVGSVVVRKKGAPGRENAPGLVLQAHVDMVCEKNEETAHDFLHDPIDIYRDGDLLAARGTTLGADNGIGVAAALAILESTEIKHGPLEVLFTVDEETGLTGASGFPGGVLRGRYFINLDSEEEGVLTIGCAGGIDTVVTRALTLQGPSPAASAYRLKLCGLKGGHSGVDINRGRANAISLLARVLHGLMPRFDLELAAIDGGNKRNAIPREAFALILADPGHEKHLSAAVAACERELLSAFGAFDPGLALVMEPATAPARVIAPPDALAIVRFLFAAPHGVVAMSPDMEGLVQTSVNLGVVATKEDRFEAVFLSRSSIDSCKTSLAARIAALAGLAGMECAHSGGYPGWKPDPGTTLVKMVTALYGRMYAKPMKVEAMHAGLECGIIGEKYPGMEMVSIGPSMWDVHTPDEKVSISSSARFLDLLQAIVESDFPG
ncbi:MAG TPA: aminoacyl-histidine dipeptidase [Geobacteraceae bacterium]